MSLERQERVVCKPRLLFVVQYLEIICKVIQLFLSSSSILLPGEVKISLKILGVLKKIGSKN
jgi:hypothetical protein